MPQNESVEKILAHGHSNVSATNKTTLEITKEKHLTKKGDCIVAIGADKALVDMSQTFKENLRKPNAKLIIMLEADGICETVTAEGNPMLRLSHPTDMVVRKSDYVCDRTLAIRADKTACDIDRELIRKLQNPNQELKVRLTVELTDKSI